MQEKLREKLPAVLAVACLAWLSYTSIRLAAADLLFRAKTLPAIERAVRLDAGNAAYRVWLADLEESEGRDPAAELRAATELNPRDSFAWMRRGLRAESEGDERAAERFLLEAARVDRQFDPRWTLMNYYFRRGARAQFWTWTRRALEMSYGDRRAIFELCWKMTQEAGEIRRALPAGAPLLAAFARSLLEHGRLADAADAAAAAHDAPLLLAVCEKGLPLGRVAPEACRSTAAFDWHASTDPEISVAAAGSGFRATLSGREAETCELAWKYVPLAPGARGRLSFGAEIDGAPSAAGLRWRLTAQPGGKILLDGWDERELTFAAEGARLGRLALTYRRALGTARMEGTVTVRDVAARVAP